MGEYFKESFELWVKKRWLNFIDREVERYRKLEVRLERQGYIVKCLADRYKELYPNNELGHYEVEEKQ